MATQIAKRFPDRVILMSMIAHNGCVKDVAAELHVGVGVIYRRLKDPKFQEALTGPLVAGVTKAAMKTIGLLDSENETIVLAASKILLDHGGHLIGMSKHQEIGVKPGDVPRGGVLVVPMSMSSEKEWEAEAQAYYKQRQIEMSKDEDEPDSFTTYEELDFDDDDERR